jgi:tetratricopeptide (TPR) repeat protein
MSSLTAPFKHEQTVTLSRNALRESIIFPLIDAETGPIAEVLANPETGAPVLARFEKGTAYRDYHQPADAERPFPKEASDSDALTAVWLFGPERVETPSTIYRRLSRIVAPKGRVLVASEVPWPGKILAQGEWGEYTTEETGAALIRAGFKDVEMIIDGPFFRLATARRSESDAFISLLEAEALLDRGDHVAAEQVLGGITAQMDSTLIVREYALLVAACHDLAGRADHALEALSEALTLDPRCARAMCGLGRIAALKGDLSSARDFFSSALKFQPALVAGLHGIAVIEEASGHLDVAYKAMIAASDLRPRNDDLMSEAARLGNAIGAFDDVARFVTQRLDKPIPTPLRNEPADHRVSSGADA